MNRCIVGMAGALLATSMATADITPFTSEAVTRGLSYSMMAYPPISGYYGFGCGFPDFDSDGDPDVIIIGAANGQVGIFENRAGTFINRSATSGVFPMTALSSFATADYDNDGDEDLFLTRVLESSMLLRNDGDFHFSEVTFAAGIDTTRLTKGACWGDFDNDGWADLFLANYFYFFGPPEASDNQLYRNNGDGTFTDVSEASNADARLFSMGLACGDLDGNGRVDFYCTNTTDPAPPLLGAFPLLLQGRKGNFVEAQDAWGVAHPTSDWGWGSTFFDWNNDGRLDLYVHDQFSPNALFQNNGGPPLVDVAAEAGVGGSNLSSYCSAYGDVDGDGDIDILMNNMGEPVTLFINKEGEKRDSISFRVIGERSRAAAIGANAEVIAGRATMYRESYAGGNSYLGQNELTLHFGLDAASIAKSAVVRWPSGGPVRSFVSVPAGRWTIYPPAKLGDAEQDGDIDAADRAGLCNAIGRVSPGGEQFDFDGDFVVGAADVAAFRSRFTAAGFRWSDLNDDSHVDAADLAILLGAWGSSECLKDLNGDGTVSASDLSILLGDWG